jgi:lathosterol oxidase
MAEDRLTTSPGVMAKQWHYRPATPIQVSPFFSGPFSIKNCLEWIASRWLRVCENSILLGLSIFCWFYLQPPLETTKVLAIDWIAAMYVRNLVLMTLVAGGLHLYFYAFITTR